MECQFCQNVFSNKQNLNAHQRKAKYCLKIQGKQPKCTFTCNICDTRFTSKYNLNRHIKLCQNDVKISKFQYERQKDKEEISLLKNTVKELREQLEKLQQDYKYISTKSILYDKDKIMKLTKKYVRKRPRKQFDARNVVYIITTPSLKKDRRYILGKATNLTNRLSTYNKTDEHEVVFYKSCNTKEMMSCIENMVFNKLSNYREQANRERFILPEDQDISFFSQKIEECISFLG